MQDCQRPCTDASLIVSARFSTGSSGFLFSGAAGSTSESILHDSSVALTSQTMRRAMKVKCKKIINDASTICKQVQ